MKSLKDILRTKVGLNSTWVAIHDSYMSGPEGNKVRRESYRVVDLDTYKRLYNGEKLRVNKQTGQIEKYQDPNRHSVRELGRSKDKSEARKFLPKK